MQTGFTPSGSWVALCLSVEIVVVDPTERYPVITLRLLHAAVAGPDALHGVFCQRLALMAPCDHSQTTAGRLDTDELGSDAPSL